MVLTASAVLGICVGLTIVSVVASADELRGPCVAFAGLLLWLSHPILVELDLRRRGDMRGGCFGLVMILLCPPVGATLYLIATYRDKAIVWIPLYLGLISAIPALGLGLAWMLGKA